MDYILSFDLGTSSLKGIIVDRFGTIVASTSVDYPLYTDKAGYSEQDPFDWIKSVDDVVNKLLIPGSEIAKNVRGISVSGQMHSLVLLDKNGIPLRNAILWNDVRTTKECLEIQENCDIIDITKNRALEGFTLPKILWVKKNEPHIWNKTFRFLLPKDYIAFYLTGKYHMDYSDASGTLLMDFTSKQWSKDIFNIFDIPIGIAPNLVNSTQCVGTLKKEISLKFKLNPDISVFAGGADNACAALSAGIIDEKRALLSIGTSGVFLSYESDNSRNYGGLLHYFNHTKTDAYYSMGVTLSAGHSLSWFKETFAPHLTFDEIVELASKVPIGADGLIFTPYIMGERTPHFDSKIRGSFTGISSSHTFGHFCRAVLEGVTYSLNESKDIMERTGKHFEEVVSVGGGSKSSLWLQMQADILNCKITTVSSENGPAIGSAMIAAMGLNWYHTFEECVDVFVKYNNVYAPIKDNVATYGTAYKTFKQIYDSIKRIGV